MLISECNKSIKNKQSITSLDFKNMIPVSNLSIQNIVIVSNIHNFQNRGHKFASITNSVTC